MNAPTEHSVDPTNAFDEPEPPVTLSAAAARATTQTLDRLDEFFRHHASGAVHAELRAYCAAQGRDPVRGADAFLDDLWLAWWPLRRALDAATAPPATARRGTTPRR